MRSFNVIYSILFFCISFTSCGGEDFEKYIPPAQIKPSEPDTKIVYHERAKELYDIIEQCYRIKGGKTDGLFNENYPKKAEDGEASYLWPYDGLVSGVALLSEIGYKLNYAEMVNGFERYFCVYGSIGGYGSSTDGVSGGGTRFYDDNSIVGLDFLDAYRLTGNKEYLEKAKGIVSFLRTGEDDVFGGGLWWNESQKGQTGVLDSNKPACSNGYATLFLLEYYTVCDQSEKAQVLAFAKRLYHWVCDNLRDKVDFCYWNDRQADGSINKIKWTYNTGVMISNGVMLYKITGDKDYLEDATHSTEGAYNYFVRPKNGLALAFPDHDPWFTTKLIKAFIDIEPYYSNAEDYIQAFVNFLDYAYLNARLTNGLFYEDWTGLSPKRAESLLMQDAALESLGIIAKYRNEKITNNYE